LNLPTKPLDIKETRRDKLLEPFLEKQNMVEELIQRSFLNNQTKRAYLLHYQTRRNTLIKGLVGQLALWSPKNVGW